MTRIRPLAAALAWLACASLAACSGPEPEAFSFDGRPLHAPPLDPETLAEREAALLSARAAYERDPRDVEAIVWLGRRTAYLGRFREAIEIYTAGLEQHPDDPRLLRHRGHRYLTTRQLGPAIKDLARAAELAASRPDRVEADGLPNARNTPTGTLRSNVWYHLGLARYLTLDFEGAAAAFRASADAAPNPDMLCATSYWRYLALRHLGREPEAQALLEPITADLDVIENHGYHRLLRMFKGELSAQDLLAESGGEDGVQSATVAFGVASWLGLEGRDDDARALLEKIVQDTPWPAFGHLAAEIELYAR